MEITHVNIGLSDNDRIKAYATITIDDCFVIQGLRLTHSKEKGYFLFMSGRKMADGTYVDIVHPLNNETRQMIQDKVVAEYERVAGKPVVQKLHCILTAPKAIKPVRGFMATLCKLLPPGDRLAGILLFDHVHD